MSRNGLHQPEDATHRAYLVAKYSRLLTRDEVQLFRDLRLILRDDEGRHFACIAIGSLLLTAEHLFQENAHLRNQQEDEAVPRGEV